MKIKVAILYGTSTPYSIRILTWEEYCIAKRIFRCGMITLNVNKREVDNEKVQEK